MSSKVAPAPEGLPTLGPRRAFPGMNTLVDEEEDVLKAFQLVGQPKGVTPPSPIVRDLGRVAAEGFPAHLALVGPFSRVTPLGHTKGTRRWRLSHVPYSPGPSRRGGLSGVEGAAPPGERPSRSPGAGRASLRGESSDAQAAKTAGEGRAAAAASAGLSPE